MGWEDPNKRREYQREWKQKNKERLRLCSKQYYLNNKDRLIKQHIEYLTKNKDKRRAYEIKYYHDNKPRIANYYRKNVDRITNYYVNNKDRIAQYYLNNRDKLIQYQAQWDKENPRSGAGLSYELQDAMNNVRIRDKNTCQWHGCGLTSRQVSIHVHHIFPRNEYQELELVEQYMICYCANHHGLWHRYRGDYYSELILSQMKVYNS